MFGVGERKCKWLVRIHSFSPPHCAAPVVGTFFLVNPFTSILLLNFNDQQFRLIEIKNNIMFVCSEYLLIYSAKTSQGWSQDGLFQLVRLEKLCSKFYWKVYQFCFSNWKARLWRPIQG